MKTNYSLSRWGIGLATFMASGATHPVCAVPSVAHSKNLKQSFIHARLCDDEEFEVADWQDSSLEEQTMITSTYAHSHDEQIVTVRVVSDEVAPFVFRDSEDEYEVEDVIYRFPIDETIVRMSASRVIEKPTMFFDDEPLSEDSDDFPPLVKHRLSARTIVKNATLSHFEPDEGASD